MTRHRSDRRGAAVRSCTDDLSRRGVGADAAWELRSRRVTTGPDAGERRSPHHRRGRGPVPGRITGRAALRAPADRDHVRRPLRRTPRATGPARGLPARRRAPGRVRLRPPVVLARADRRLGAGAARPARRRGTPARGHLAVYLLAVAPTHRGRGLGGALLAALVAAAGRPAWLSTRDEPTPARALYERLGWRPVGHGPDAPNGQPAVVLLLDEPPRPVVESAASIIPT
ncbi:GNAT family N-acetyltransferase [Modestobacter roseus]|uniref:GNAT family N-acetyltransferase n=1 Tax=Modestobacter roseus TaxID=1181884 RepID=UPI0034DE0AC6